MDIRGRTMGHLTQRARYLQPTGQQRSLGLFCLGAGEQSGDVSPVRLRTLDCHAAVLIDAGAGTLTIGSGTVPVHGPTLFWLFPGVEHSYGPDRSGWRERWVLFDGSAVGAYGQLAVLDRRRPLWPLADDSPPIGRLRQVVRTVMSGDHRDLLGVTGLLHLLIAEAAPRLTPGDPAEQLLADLRGNAFDQSSVQTHARRLGRTVRQLRAEVRRAAGTSPNDFLIGVRIERAQQLLVSTDRTIAAIATEVGYPDAGYFTRIFTGRVGRAPSVFRDTEQRR